MEQKCANCGNGKWRDGITEITDTCIKCHYVDKGALGTQPSNWKPKEQTNADRIRAMSDDELYDLLKEAYNAGCDDATAYEWGSIRNSFEWTEEWLKQPAE